jgi:hypothetical protein
MSEKLNNHPTTFRFFFNLFASIAGTSLFIIILGSDLFVSGAVKTNISILRVPGEYYFLILSYLLSCILIGTYLIVISIKNSKNPLDKKRRTVIFFSLLPFIFTLNLVFILIQLNSIVNLSLFLPYCTLMFLIAYLFTETRKDLYKFLIYIPYSSERIAHKELNDRVIEYMSKTQMEEQISLREAMHTIERAFVTRALKIKDGDHNLAAELLSTSMSTVYRNKEKVDKDKK